MTLVHSEPQTLVGHRLIRRIGSGARSEVFLGVPDGGGEGMALKVYRPGVASESIATELSALERGRSDHIVRLDDLGSGPDGRPVAILRRLPRASLARLIADRESIELGEAVTILVPLVGAVAGLHRAGVVHTAIGSGSVLFGARGEPVLAGFGHAQLIPPGQSIAALDTVDEVVAERRRLARFVAGGLERARAGDAKRAIDDLTGWLADERTIERFEYLEELRSRLFDLATPLPVTFAPAPVSIVVPGRLEGAAAAAHDGDERRRETVRSVPIDGRLPDDSRRARRVAETIERTIDRGPSTIVASWVTRVRSGVRRPFWIALGVVVVALVCAISLIPSSAPARTVPGGAPSEPASTEPAPSVPASSESTRPESTRPGSAPQSLPDQATASSSSDSPSSIAQAGAPSTQMGPADAFVALIGRRSACVGDRSLGCLNDVDEDGSPAALSDSAAVHELQRGAERDDESVVVDPDTAPKLVERLGAAAIVRYTSNGEPALVLLMSTSAGWRIRDYLDRRTSR